MGRRTSGITSFAILMALSLAACSTAESPPAASPEIRADTPAADGEKQSIAENPLPEPQQQKPTLFLQITSPPEGKERYRKLKNFYVRLLVEPAANTAGGTGTESPMTRDYEHERRDVLRRLVWGRSWSVNLSVEIKVPSRNIDLKLPLMVWSHGSNATVGEVWLTEVSGNRLMNSHFLASPDMAMQVGLIHTQANEVSTEAIRTAVNAARTILEVADPGVKAITILSNGKLKSASSAVDRTIGQLFSSSLEERLTNSYTVSRMLAKEPLTFESGVPGDEWRDGSSYRRVGTWSIRLSNPKPSIFSNVEYCGDDAAKDDNCVADEVAATIAVMQGLDPFAVLATEVAAEKSIGEYLSEAPWYKTLFPLIKNAVDSNQREALGGICSATLQEIARLPLSPLDGKIVLWAVLKTSALTPAAVDEAAKREECKEALALGQ